MKRLTAILLLLAFFSFGSAQNNWLGLRSGYPLGLSLHYGVANGFSSGVDLRVSVNIQVFNRITRFGLGVDALNTFYRERPFSAYFGGGAAANFGGPGPLFGLSALLGGEFRFTDLGLDPLGIFAEARVGAEIGKGGRIPAFGAAIGFNYHF